MKFIIFIICYFLSLSGYLSIKTAQSSIKIWPVGTAFQPANAVELLSITTAPSFLICGSTCNINIQCRTFVYDLISKGCTLYEGEVSTGIVLTNSSTTKLGSIIYFTNLYGCYNKTDDQCSFDRYLTADNSSNLGVCPIHTYWNGSMCLNQVYSGTSCTSDEMCRMDLALRCDAFYNQTCSGGKKQLEIKYHDKYLCYRLWNEFGKKW